MSQLADLTVKQALEALNSLECSSVELTAALLDRTEKLEPSVQAYFNKNT